jgi:hypothetical protein
MNTTTSPLPDEALIEAANKTLALYYHLFFTRHKRPSAHREQIASAFLELLPQREVQATADTGTSHIHLLIEDQIPLRILMTRWISDEEEQRLRTLMARRNWSIGLLVNFGAPKPQLRRLFLNSSP